MNTNLLTGVVAYLKSHTWTTVFIAFVPLFVIVFLILQPILYADLYTTAPVEKGTLTQEVSANGAVESPSNISLAFKAAGKIKSIPVSAGDSVEQGQLLAQLDARQIESQIASMDAALDIQKAKLEQLIVGATQEDIAITQSSVIAAEAARKNAEQNLAATIRDAFSKADDAVRTKTDVMFLNPRKSYPQLLFLVPDSQLQLDVEDERVALESMLIAWQTDIAALSTLDSIVMKGDTAIQNINMVANYLDDLSLLVNAAVVGGGVTQTNIDTYKTNVATARTTINTTLTNLTAHQGTLRSAESSLVTAQNQLRSKTSSPRPVDIQVYEGQIAQARASLEQVIAERNDYAIYAPVKGTITNTTAELGENVAANNTIVSMIPDATFQITINVSENNVALVRVGQSVRISLEAFPELNWKGTVSHIDPAETNVSGAIYYQATVVFDQKDERIRSGMTANIWIQVAQKERVLFVPAGAIQTRDGLKYVSVLSGRTEEEREITTGIYDARGNVEIMSGVREGELVILAKK